VDGLPAKTGRAFLMREVMELSTDEICKELGITPTHCWVMLHRARLALRQCLETGWLGKK
jgi:RNA polymerase sigma-70 factor (ECF subfamily)